jgi:hypothetical protein
MDTVIAISIAVVAAAAVAAIALSLDLGILRLEAADGTLDQVAGSLRFRVPVGPDAASVVVSLHRQGYDVTTRYEHGQTSLYIGTVSDTSEEREAIRSLIYNADQRAHQEFLPPAPRWQPQAVVFDDENPTGQD